MHFNTSSASHFKCNTHRCSCRDTAAARPDLRSKMSIKPMRTPPPPPTDLGRRNKSVLFGIITCYAASHPGSFLASCLLRFTASDLPALGHTETSGPRCEAVGWVSTRARSRVKLTRYGIVVCLLSETTHTHGRSALFIFLLLGRRRLPE